MSVKDEIIKMIELVDDRRYLRIIYSFLKEIIKNKPKN